MFSLFGENHPICLILLAFFLLWFSHVTAYFLTGHCTNIFTLFLCICALFFFFLWKFCNPLELCSKCWRKVGLHPNTFGLRRRICSVIHSFFSKKEVCRMWDQPTSWFVQELKWNFVTIFFPGFLIKKFLPRIHFVESVGVLSLSQHSHEQ